MNITKIACDFEREPLLAPFGFKGGKLSELWQAVVAMDDADGSRGVGLGTQSVLWSDAGLFFSHPEAASNSLMFLTTCHAARAAKGVDCADPFDLQDKTLADVYAYARKICGRDAVRKTFALNAMVAVDFAAWQLHAQLAKAKSFDDLVPASLKAAQSRRHELLAAIPLISYGVKSEAIEKALDDGHFLLKIKIGSDPKGDGDLDKMLEWDMRRLEEIHELAKNKKTAYTESGHVPYYLDANGRYDSKERLRKLLAHAEKIGALERVILLEEPFPEELKVDVRDLPARIVADESAHSDEDAIERIRLGYGAIALKPIAKTLSMSLKIAKIAHDEGVPCFCADLTVNPILVDWNKNVAARLDPLPGLKIGVLESNGPQNYRNWDAMKTYHPRSGRQWIEMRGGLFRLDDDFYATSGGIFEKSEHYAKIVA